MKFVSVGEPYSSFAAARHKFGTATYPTLQLPRGQGWLFAFLHAVALTPSPSQTYKFFCDLDRSDPLLSRLGWALLCAVPAFALLGYVDFAILHTVSPWIKPIKFAISFASYAWTVSLLFDGLRLPAWQSLLARRAVVVSVIFEMLALSAEAWRRSAHTTRNSADALITHTTTAMVGVNTAIVVLLLVLFCRPTWIRIVDAAMVAAIRLGTVIFLIGNVVGGYMLARGSHTVGAPDGGPGLPFVNWSTIGGDLRIAHFIAIHAIQIVPLFAYVMAQMVPRPRLKARMIAVYAASILLFLAVAWTFVQASLARPLLALTR